MLVEFAEQSYEQNHSIALQARLGDDSEQDRELGLDSYCLSDDLGRSVYDCVVACEVSDGALRLELSDAAVNLGFERQLIIGLDVDERLVAIACSALSVVFGKYGAAGAPTLIFQEAS